jgi:uncharacterized membrane protein
LIKTSAIAIHPAHACTRQHRQNTIATRQVVFYNGDLNAFLWRGVAAIYAFVFLIAFFGFIALLQGDITGGIIVIAASSLVALIAHKAIKNNLKDRNY